MVSTITGNGTEKSENRIKKAKRRAMHRKALRYQLFPEQVGVCSCGGRSQDDEVPYHMKQNSYRCFFHIDILEL